MVLTPKAQIAILNFNELLTILRNYISYINNSKNVFYDILKFNEVEENFKSKFYFPIYKSRNKKFYGVFCPPFSDDKNIKYKFIIESHKDHKDLEKVIDFLTVYDDYNGQEEVEIKNKPKQINIEIYLLKFYDQ